MTVLGRIAVGMIATRLHGAGLKHRDVNRGGPGLGEGQRERKGFAHLQWRVEADEHDVVSSGLEFDGFPGGKIDAVDLTHAHDVAFDNVGMQFGFRRNRT